MAWDAFHDRANMTDSDKSDDREFVLVTDEFRPTSSDDAISKYSDALLKKMHLTKGARFQSARRHKARSTASVWSIIFLSMYVFSTSVVSYIYSDQYDPVFVKFLVVLNIIMSAFIIAFSVLEQGKQHDLKADLFLRCSQNISKLHDDLYLHICMQTMTKERAFEFNSAYQATINSFSDNHTNVDYRTFRANAGWHKENPLLVAFIHTRYWIDCWSILVAALVAPPLAITIYVLLNPTTLFLPS